MDPVIREIKKKIKALEREIRTIYRTEVRPAIKRQNRNLMTIMKLRKLAASLNGKPIRITRKKSSKNGAKS